MNSRNVAACLGLAAAVQAACGLALGAGPALLAAPPAAGLVLLALWARRGDSRRQPGWIVVAGAVSLLLGLGFLLLSPAIGLVTLALGTGVIFTGTQLSLYADEPVDGLEITEPLSLRVNAAVAADESLRCLWHGTSLLSPSPSPGDVAEHVLAAAERNRSQGILEDPRRAHPTPPSLEKVELRPVRVPGAGAAEHLLYESEYAPLDPEIRNAYQDVTPNRTAHAVLWRHARGPRPTLVCVHGYGMGRIGFDARTWDLGWLHERLGLDVAAIVLPLHGARAVGRRSGAGFLDGHPLFANAAFGQAVWELRRLTGWLRAQGAPAVGITGMSLGGYVTALYASIDRQLACAIPTIPVADLVELGERDLSEERRLALDAVGLTRQVRQDAFASHSPLRHHPRVAPERRLIVAGLADRICPPDQALRLHEHWSRPALHWFPGSHLVPLGRAATRARIESHLRATLLAAPSSGSLPLTRFRT